MVGLASFFSAAALGLTPTAIAAACVITVVSIIITSAALLSVGFVFPLGYNVLPTALHRVTCAGGEGETGEKGFKLCPLPRPASIAWPPAKDCSD